MELHHILDGWCACKVQIHFQRNELYKHSLGRRALNKILKKKVCFAKAIAKVTFNALHQQMDRLKLNKTKFCESNVLNTEYIDCEKKIE